MTIEESQQSVCYRTGRLTFTDYDEAIDDLQAARLQAIELERGGGAFGCAICTDGDHTAESCHHNPMVLARRWAAASGMWNCYHCGYIAYNDEDAKAHFGRHDDEVVKCISNNALRDALALAYMKSRARQGQRMPLSAAREWADLFLSKIGCDHG